MSHQKLQLIICLLNLAYNKHLDLPNPTGASITVLTRLRAAAIGNVNGRIAVLLKHRPSVLQTINDTILQPASESVQDINNMTEAVPP